MNHDEWLDRWFEGDLSTAELAGFEAELRKDDLLRRSLVERSLLEANLIDTLAGTARVRNRRRRPIRQTRSWAPFAAAAALLLGALIFISTRPKPPEPAVVRQPRIEREARETELNVIKEREAQVVKQKPPDDDAALKKWEEEIAKIQAERAAKERELELARQNERAIVPPPPAPPPPTQAAIARVTTSGAQRDVLPGDRVAGAATIEFPDGTKVESDTLAEMTVDGGRIDVVKGGLVALGRIALHTPHADVAIDGTARVVVASSTRIEVDGGTARVKRSKDGKSVQVKQGFATDSADLALKPLPLEEPVLRFDFEDGKRPPSLLEGEVGKGPDRKFVLNGSEKRERGTLRRQIAIEKKDGLFTVADSMVLRFDCWMKGGSSELSVYLWDATQNANLFVVVKGIRENGWAKIVVKFADLRVEGDASRGAKTGDVIGNLLISLFDEQPAVLHLDNLEVTRPRKK